MSRKWLFSLILSSVVAVTSGCNFSDSSDGNAEKKKLVKFEKQEQRKVVSVDELQDRYDVIVVGTDPEGISAAVSAARNGQKTLLVEGRSRTLLGGLMTEGWLNSIDMNWDRKTSQDDDYLNKGIFKEWYDKTEGHSFDVTTAANAFYDLVRAESNIDLYVKSQDIEPIVKKSGEAGLVEGISIAQPDGTKLQVLSNAVIDATQDADIAAAAGASFTIGREDLGDPTSRMAATAVFRLKNVDDTAWDLIAKRLNGDNDANTGVSELSAWGYGNEMKGYEPINKERTKMRGLNIGRQLDGTILLNALHIFGIDGLSAESRQEGLDIAAKELPNVVKYLQQFEEFKNVELDAIAPELYIRETRHMNGLYRLNVVDLLENRDQWDRIAFGSYPADIQRTAPSDNGAVVVDPIQYAVPFRSIVPREIDGLLVVGRSASYDTLAHGSARVIPTGMAEGEAAGAAAKLASERGVTFRAMAESKPLIAELQQRLNKQGMDLQPYTAEPQPFTAYPTYAGLKAAVYMGIAYGSYGNAAFEEDKPSNAKRLVNQMGSVKRMYKDYFKGDPSAAIAGLETPEKTVLTLSQASYTIAQTLGMDISLDKAQTELESRGILSKATVGLITNKDQLTDQQVYMIIKDALESVAGLRL
ncbi:FAD-dependent oxidoreductase [Cohnella faecalis]|uniref:FAD-dependent oxidoreductase n=2 Tax=Cohnella faecalis TaxID=2315694 RepID=UPI00360FF5B5